MGILVEYFERTGCSGTCTGSCLSSVHLAMLFPFFHGTFVTHTSNV
jgi:hypothetical protein